MWKHVLEKLQEKLSPESYETWIVPLRIGPVEGETITLKIPSQFLRTVDFESLYGFDP